MIHGIDPPPPPWHCSCPMCRHELARSIEHVFRRHPGRWMGRRHVAFLGCLLGYPVAMYDEVFDSLVARGRLLRTRGGPFGCVHLYYLSVLTSRPRRPQEQEGGRQ